MSSREWWQQFDSYCAARGRKPTDEELYRAYLCRIVGLSPSAAMVENKVSPDGANKAGSRVYPS